MHGIFWGRSPLSSLPPLSFESESEIEVTQSRPTLCYPMDCCLLGSSTHGIFQARILEWVSISFSSGLPNSGIKPWSPTLQADSLPSEPPGKPTIVWPQVNSRELLELTPKKDVLFIIGDWNASQVMSDSFWPHGLQHTRLPYPLPSFGVHLSSYLMHWWYRPTISSSVTLFFCLQFLPASGSFTMSQVFASGGLWAWLIFNQALLALQSVLPSIFFFFLNIFFRKLVIINSFCLFKIYVTLKNEIFSYFTTPKCLS